MSKSKYERIARIFDDSDDDDEAVEEELDGKQNDLCLPIDRTEALLKKLDQIDMNVAVAKEEEPLSFNKGGGKSFNFKHKKRSQPAEFKVPVKNGTTV